jgi:hypothetical protein
VNPTLIVPSGATNSFPLFQPGEAWSFSVWVNPSAASTSLFVLTEQNDAAYGCDGQILSLQIATAGSTNPGSPRIGQCNNAGISFSGSVTFGAWNHLVYQYDGNSTFQVYLNGVNLPFDSSSSVFQPVKRAAQVTSVYLNAPENNARTGVFGELSTLRVYSAPLTPCEVQSDLAGLRQPGLLAEYVSQYNQQAPFQVQLTDAIAQGTASYFACNSGNFCGI